MKNLAITALICLLFISCITAYILYIETRLDSNKANDLRLQIEHIEAEKKQLTSTIELLNSKHDSLSKQIRIARQNINMQRENSSENINRVRDANTVEHAFIFAGYTDIHP